MTWPSPQPMPRHPAVPCPSCPRRYLHPGTQKHISVACSVLFSETRVQPAEQLWLSPAVKPSALAELTNIRAHPNCNELKLEVSVTPPPRPSHSCTCVREPWTQQSPARRAGERMSPPLSSPSSPVLPPLHPRSAGEAPRRGTSVPHMYLYYRILQELSPRPHREGLGTPHHPSPGVCRDTSQRLKPPSLTAVSNSETLSLSPASTHPSSCPPEALLMPQHHRHR